MPGGVWTLESDVSKLVLCLHLYATKPAEPEVVQEQKVERPMLLGLPTTEMMLVLREGAGYRNLQGGWQLIMMEYLAPADGWCLLPELQASESLRSGIRSLLAQAHDLGYVHGDCRIDNITAQYALCFQCRSRRAILCTDLC